MGHRDGMDSWDLGKMVWDIPGNPVQSRWVIGMGWTVGIWVRWCGRYPRISSSVLTDTGYKGSPTIPWDCPWQYWTCVTLGCTSLTLTCTCACTFDNESRVSEPNLEFYKTSLGWFYSLPSLPFSTSSKLSL